MDNGLPQRVCDQIHILYLLRAYKPLTDFFSDANWEDSINTNNPLGSGGKVVRAFRDVLFASEADLDTAVSAFITAMGGLAPHLAEKGDSTEYLAFLLDALHEDLCRVLQKPYLQFPSYVPGQDLTEFINQYTALKKRRDDSFIFDHCSGLTLTEITDSTCPNQCQQKSPNPYVSLSLPIPNNAEVTLQDCITAFKAKSRLAGNDQYFCTNCREMVDANVSTAIFSTPNLLFFTFRRISFGRQPNWTPVKLPKELDMSPFLDHPDPNPHYELIGITDLGGRYQDAVVKQENEWKRYTWGDVQEVSEASLDSAKAFIAAYQRKNQ